MWLTKAHTSQEAPTSTSGSSSLIFYLRTFFIPFKVISFDKKCSFIFTSLIKSVLKYFLIKLLKYAVVCNIIKKRISIYYINNSVYIITNLYKGGINMNKNLKSILFLFLLVISSSTFTSTLTTKRMRANSIRINALEINKMEALKEEPPEEMTIVLDDRALNFDFDKSVVKPQYNEMLTNLKDFIEKNDYEVTIVGHTDYIASNAYNMGLSKRRAEAVKAKLIELGLDPSRIVGIVPRGEEEPIADNATTEGRAKNRRVEFKLVKRGSKGEVNSEESRVIDVKKEEVKTEN